MLTSLPAHESTLPDRSILIVEDDATLGKLLLEVLQEETNYQVYLVPDAETALNMLQTVTPELFLLDYHLPGMSGLELADQLRSREGGKHVPILIMSADLPYIDIAKKQLKSLQKPFDLDAFLLTVTELLAPS
ncbi:MAG: response regulator [Ktedonobacteraceae bacterium]|nr:response regulator [Ktedonobacteraceae bacterium]MBO0792943.1 response regulator [Ktedonobacteraceae bacterium]